VPQPERSGLTAEDTVEEARPEPDADPEPGPDLEWLFERDRDTPLGWAFDPATASTQRVPTPAGTGSGSTSTEGVPAWRDSGRTGRSPWMVLAVFAAILVLLMLLSYIAGMAYTTVVNRS